MGKTDSGKILMDEFPPATRATAISSDPATFQRPASPRLSRHLHQPQFTVRQVLLAFLGGFVGIAALGHLSQTSGYPLIAAPLGATSVLVYGLPDSPLAQPRNVICGNFLGALIAVALVATLGTSPWAMGLAVAGTIALTQLTRTVHPPAGAVALVGVMSHASLPFVLTPVLLGSLVLVMWTHSLGRLVPERAYPKYWL